MTATLLTDVSNQVMKVWSPLGADEFIQSTLLPALVNRDFTDNSGSPVDINRMYDTVYVSQLSIPTGETRTAGVDADSFSPEKMSLSRVAISVNKRFVASYEFEDLVQLQSQLGAADSEIRMALMQALAQQVNSYCYGLVVPSTSAPDHLLNGVSDFNSAQMATIRKLAGKAKWPKPTTDWYLLADPSYHSDIMDDTTLANADYGQTDRPVISGQMGQPRFGFNVFEDNSDGLLNLFASGGALGLTSTAGEDYAIAFHKKFMHLVLQKQPRFMVSSKHSNNQFGYVISADLLGGAVLATNGDEKVIATYNT